MKREFDRYRAQGVAHPMMTESGIRAVPHAHPELEAWRNNFRGVRTTHAGTNLELFGAIDDLWRDLDSGELMVVDYKATSKSAEVTLDAPWQDGYRLRGADGVLPVAHQWLLRRRGAQRVADGRRIFRVPPPPPSRRRRRRR